MEFVKAKVEWRQFEKEDGVKVSLRMGINVTDSVKGTKHFRVKIVGDDLQEILTAQDPHAKGLEVVKRVLKPRYLDWVGEEEPVKTTETIPGNPEFTDF